MSLLPLLSVAVRQQGAVAFRHASSASIYLCCKPICGVSFLPPSSCVQNCRRSLSTSDDSQQEQQINLYEAPLSRPVRSLKLVSVTSATLTVIGLPIATFLGSPEMAMASKIAVTGTVCTFAAVTTAVLHWVTKAYVRSISVSESDAKKIALGNVSDVSKIRLEVETLSFFAMPVRTTFFPQEIVYPLDATVFTSFLVHGRSFFVHKELVEQSSPLRTVIPGIMD
eukprot:m.14141 g.14141  ORF g.14141 m.14141 type:complete len:225 (-) comp4262_c0_seq2:192-866(-)